MATVIQKRSKSGGDLHKSQWLTIGLMAALGSVAAVLVVQAIALAIWPDIASFPPLDSTARIALFTAIRAFGATGIFAWLARRRPQPVAAFLKISAVVLLLSIIPDYALPAPNKTLLASTVTALLHIVAAIVTVFVIVTAYERQSGR
jgi:peptidoglycan/LPS O-acetylase OafA/YrhL